MVDRYDCMGQATLLNRLKHASDFKTLEFIEDQKVLLDYFNRSPYPEGVRVKDLRKMPIWFISKNPRIPAEVTYQVVVKQAMEKRNFSSLGLERDKYLRERECILALAENILSNIDKFDLKQKTFLLLKDCEGSVREAVEEFKNVKRK